MDWTVNYAQLPYQNTHFPLFILIQVDLTYFIALPFSRVGMGGVSRFPPSRLPVASGTGTWTHCPQVGWQSVQICIILEQK